jgi:hypothetical protein
LIVSRRGFRYHGLMLLNVLVMRGFQRAEQTNKIAAMRIAGILV